VDPLTIKLHCEGAAGGTGRVSLGCGGCSACSATFQALPGRIPLPCKLFRGAYRSLSSICRMVITPLPGLHVHERQVQPTGQLPAPQLALVVVGTADLGCKSSSSGNGSRIGMPDLCTCHSCALVCGRVLVLHVCAHKCVRIIMDDIWRRENGWWVDSFVVR